MKLPCEMIQDILPLYHDGVCSEVSKNLVEEHLQGCEKCTGFLRSIDLEIETPVDAAEAQPLQAIQKTWGREKKRAWVKGFAIAALIFILLNSIFAALTQWRFIEVTTSGMSVAEIYRLEDGRILYRLDTPSNTWSRSFEFADGPNGESYKIPIRAVVELNETEGWPSYLDDYMMIDEAENNAWNRANGYPETKQWYIGAPNDCLLIYEAGMELEPAPDHLEEQVKRGMH